MVAIHYSAAYSVKQTPRIMLQNTQQSNKLAS